MSDVWFGDGADIGLRDKNYSKDILSLLTHKDMREECKHSVQSNTGTDASNLTLKAQLTEINFITIQNIEMH